MKTMAGSASQNCRRKRFSRQSFLFAASQKNGFFNENSGHESEPQLSREASLATVLFVHCLPTKKGVLTENSGRESEPQLSREASIATVLSARCLANEKKGKFE